MKLPQRLCLRPGAVPNRTYRAWGLPKYFLKLHQTPPARKGQVLLTADHTQKRCVINSSFYRLVRRNLGRSRISLRMIP